jgi:hypothetical protein
VPMLPNRVPMPSYSGNVKFGFRLSGERLLRSQPRIHRVGPPPFPSPPDMIDWIGNELNWGVMGNDEAGDCVLACFGHLIEAWTGAAGRRTPVPDQSILAAYSALTGYNPQTGSPDPGLLISAAIEYWRTVGIEGHKVDLAAGANAAATAQLGGPSINEAHIKYAVCYFGAAILGLNLPSRAVDVFYQGGVWDANMGPGTEGHCVPVMAYDATHCDAITWGRPQRMTWSFIGQYTAEIWAATSLDWISSNGQSPLGHSQQYLNSNLNGVINITPQ